MDGRQGLEEVVGGSGVDALKAKDLRRITKKPAAKVEDGSCNGPEIPDL